MTLQCHLLANKKDEIIKGLIGIKVDTKPSFNEHLNHKLNQ